MKITELELVCRNLDGQRHFYSEVLGLPLLESATPSFTVQVGQTRLIFHSQPEMHGVHHFAFNIPENQLTAARSWIAKRAPLLERDAEAVFTADDDWNAQMFYFRDPDGNILECIARHRLANASATAFGSDSLLSVSEIGYPVEDVPKSAKRLRQQLGLKVFGAASDTFVPLGDDEGLLILVKLGRNWFPTQQAAQSLPLVLTVQLSPLASPQRLASS